MSFRRFTAALATVSLAALSVACDDEDNRVSVDGTLKADGYALFAVDNDRQQRADVVVTVREADPDATYVLLYSASAPRNVGWFLFDPSTKSRCGGDVGSHCEVDGYGYMVDYVKVPAGATDITLRDQRCGCDGNDKHREWTGHWAVMRIERTERENKVSFEVTPKKIDTFTDEPTISQLQ
ncbi:MAG: hypothetical protein KIT84_24295 [Labilithrix sp.]|nr:hypothetical protein [Labilithrix sp.]MCW5814171.1 hypothetical protein [Labilithrix sp.]